jgi:hypothetical protein
VLAIGGWWLVAGGRPRVQLGLSANIDPAPFTNPAKAAQPVSQVIKPNGKGAPRKRYEVRSSGGASGNLSVERR